MALGKWINIQDGHEVLDGGRDAVADGVRESARCNGGVFRSWAVPGAEVKHLENS